MTYIGLLDCNNFFVSCERLFRPDLRQVPVAVLSSNDGCVVARSQEIKDSGVPMGVPYFKVKDIIKDIDATTFSSHFALYRDISRRVFEVMRTELDTVEQYSVDEAFFVLKDDVDPLEVIACVKDKVEQHVGVPVSIGVAHSKTLAKYAGDIAKKADGLYVLSDEDWSKRASTAKLADLWGVGYRSAQKYTQAQLYTAQDLLEADSARIAKLFGIGGVRLQQELSGEAVYKVGKKREPQKSLMSSRSFRDTTTDKSVVQDALAYHVRHTAAELRSMGMKARYVRISALPSRHSDFVLQGSYGETTLDRPSNDTFVLLDKAQTLLDTVFRANVPYKKVGVILGGFTPADVTQMDLFTNESEPATTPDILAVIDAVNDKEGKETITIGNRLQNTKWRARTDLRSPAYTTRWQDVQTVKA